MSLAIATVVPLQPTYHARCPPWYGVCYCNQRAPARLVPSIARRCVCVWHEPCYAYAFHSKHANDTGQTPTHCFLSSVDTPPCVSVAPSLRPFLSFGFLLDACFRNGPLQETSVSGPASLAGFRFIGPPTRVLSGLSGCLFWPDLSGGGSPLTRVRCGLPACP